MSDDLTHIDKAVISLTTVAGFAMTIAGALWKRNENRADSHEKRLSKLEADMQSKVDFKHHGDAIESMRQEQQAATERIMQSIERVNAQLYDVYKILINNGKQG